VLGAADRDHRVDRQVEAAAGGGDLPDAGEQRIEVAAPVNGDDVGEPQPWRVFALQQNEHATGQHQDGSQHDQAGHDATPSRTRSDLETKSDESSA
jgi:hypothetical protein